MYSNTRVDREKWVHIWRLIADMNRDGISTAKMTPFVYEKARAKDTRTIELDQVKQAIEKKEKEIISRISESRK